ncbi:MAG: hypothetical protein ABIN99_06890 [Nitrosospira sp.]
MDTAYKGYSIVSGSEYDDASCSWNGRYRILNDKGIVVYESFVEPLHEEDTAAMNANAEARAWIDKQ